ncbi:MAG: TetR/AcrR family transcriptional regulator [Vampirovibrionales bacterium]
MMYLPELDTLPPSKAKLIQTCLTLMSAQGYESTGIQEILSQAEVSKSNFYYHYPSKEALFLDTLERYIHGFIHGKLQTTLLNKSLSPKERIYQFCLEVYEVMMCQSCQVGCPFVNLATETSDFFPAFREQLSAFFARFKAFFTACIAEGIAMGEFKPTLNPEEAGALFLSAFHGSLIYAKTTRNPQGIRQNAELLLTLLS